MLTLGNFIRVVTSDDASILTGDRVYVQKKAVGEPVGLLLAITSPGNGNYAIKVNSGLIYL